MHLSETGRQTSLMSCGYGHITFHKRPSGEVGNSVAVSPSPSPFISFKKQ